MEQVLTSRENPTIKHITRLGRELFYRREHGLMLCDGEKMLSEAVNSGITPHHIIYSGDVKTPAVQSQLIKVPEKILTGMSSLKSPPRLLFTVPIPNMQVENLTSGNHLILDRLQDPGNVGSIIRTARAFGITSVILTPGCADITNPKALRASMGAVFGQRVMYGEPQEILTAAQSIKCYSTGLRPNALPLQSVKLENCAVVIGNEGAGISECWNELEMLTIPINFESLGAASAAAIIMWEMRKC